MFFSPRTDYLLPSIYLSQDRKIMRSGSVKERVRVVCDNQNGNERADNVRRCR